MTNEQSQAAPLLTYEVWKIQFHKDCEIEGKLPAFDSLGEYALKLLWGNGLAPTVRAVVGSIDDQTELSPETDSLAPQSAPEKTKP